jgi:hypothetical protein
VPTAFVGGLVVGGFSCSEISDGVGGHVADDLAVRTVDPSHPVTNLFRKGDHGKTGRRPVLVLNVDDLQYNNLSFSIKSGKPCGAYNICPSPDSPVDRRHRYPRNRHTCPTSHLRSHPVGWPRRRSRYQAVRPGYEWPRYHPRYPSSGRRRRVPSRSMFCYWQEIRRFRGVRQGNSRTSRPVPKPHLCRLD